MAKSGTGRDVFIYDAVRTPRGKGRSTGALHTVKPISLLVGLIDGIRDRNPDLDTNLIDDVIIGCTAPLNDQGADIARVAALAAGLPETVAGVQLNRFCASGLEAVNTAAQKIASGWDSAILAGGVESMSRQAMASDGGAWVNDPETSMATGFVPQGIGADLIATLEGFTRRDVDEWAVTSQERAHKAQQNGYFERSIVPVVDRAGTVVLDRDEYPRAATTLESLAGLKPSFASLGFDEVALGKYHWLERIDHVHHAGNSSGIVDGASLVLLGSEEFGKATGLQPRARVLSTAIVGSEPTIMLTGPTPASRKALASAGLSVDDVALFEINEAFASVVLKFMKDLELPADQVNVNGGAIALGHPLGATGGMLVGTVLDELERRDEQVGLITLCVGAGMGITTIIERV